MTTLSLSPFSWVLESLWLKSSPAEPLRKDLESFDMQVFANPPSDTPLHKAVAYLSKHSNSKLEQAVKDKFAKATPEIRKAALNTIGTVLDDANHARMLRVCKKIMDLNLLKETFEVDNVAELAESESHYTPNSARLIEVISNPVWNYWKKHRHYFGKILNLVVVIPMGTLVSIASTVSYILRKPPYDIMQLENYIMSFGTGSKYLYEKYKQGIQYLSGYFGSEQKAYAALIAISVSILALNYLRNWFRLGRVEDLSQKGGFENLNHKVKEGLIEPTEARKEQKKILENCCAESITSEKSATKTFRIAMLIGPTGCGKTQFMEGVAWDCENTPESPFYGKQVYQINTELLTSDHYFMDKVMERIKGYEDDFILFFDEAHSAGSEGGKIGRVLQIFKTKLPPNIRVCLATTKIEFEQYIKPDLAFVDRIKEIYFDPLPDDDTRVVLKNAVKLESDSPIEIDENAYDAILKVVETDLKYSKRANPRKSLQLLNEFANDVFQWTPTLIDKELETATREEKKAVNEIEQASNKNENWSSSLEGRKAIANLKTKRKDIQTLKDRKLAQQQHRQKISGLQKLQALYRKQKNEAIHFLAANPTHQEEAEKKFLLLKFVFLPQMRKALQNAAASFEKEYKEKIPLTLDADWIKSRFPASFSSEPPSQAAAS